MITEADLNFQSFPVYLVADSEEVNTEQIWLEMQEKLRSTPLGKEALQLLEKLEPKLTVSFEKELGSRGEVKASEETPILHLRYPTRELTDVVITFVHELTHVLQFHHKALKTQYEDEGFFQRAYSSKKSAKRIFIAEADANAIQAKFVEQLKSNGEKEIGAADIFLLNALKGGKETFAREVADRYKETLREEKEVLEDAFLKTNKSYALDAFEKEQDISFHGLTQFYGLDSLLQEENLHSHSSFIEEHDGASIFPAVPTPADEEAKPDWFDSLLAFSENSNNAPRPSSAKEENFLDLFSEAPAKKKSTIKTKFSNARVNKVEDDLELKKETATEEETESKKNGWILWALNELFLTDC